MSNERELDAYALERILGGGYAGNVFRQALAAEHGQNCRGADVLYGRVVGSLMQEGLQNLAEHVMRLAVAGGVGNSATAVYSSPIYLNAARCAEGARTRELALGITEEGRDTVGY